MRLVARLRWQQGGVRCYFCFLNFNLNLNIMNKLYQCPYCESKLADVPKDRSICDAILTISFVLIWILSLAAMIIFHFLGETQNYFIALAFMWIGFIGYRAS